LREAAITSLPDEAGRSFNDAAWMASMMGQLGNHASTIHPRSVTHRQQWQRSDPD
jgi:hypothetical protein